MPDIQVIELDSSDDEQDPVQSTRDDVKSVLRGHTETTQILEERRKSIDNLLDQYVKIIEALDAVKNFMNPSQRQRMSSCTVQNIFPVKSEANRVNAEPEPTGYTPPDDLRYSPLPVLRPYVRKFKRKTKAKKRVSRAAVSRTSRPARPPIPVRPTRPQTTATTARRSTGVSRPKATSSSAPTPRKAPIKKESKFSPPKVKKERT